MFRSKRVLWAAGVFIAAFFLAPATALCVEEDPYIYRTLIGRVYFEYQKNNTQSKTSKSESSRFQQVYSLDVRGNFISRNLLIYDAGVSYAINDYTAGGASSETDTTSYFGRTTLLPKSNIPLTLTGSKTESMSGGDASTSTSYGLSWTVKVRPLPIMQLSLDTSKHESPGSEYESNKFRFDARKDIEIGPSKNSIYFTRVSTSNSNTADTSLYTLNLINETKISKSTDLDFTASRNGSEQEGVSDTTSEGYTISLASTPGIDFTQNHAYTYYSTKNDDGKQEGSTYSGRMSNQFSRDLSTSLSLTFNTSDSESATIDRESKSLASSGNISYRLLSNLTLSEAVSYSNFETSSSDQTTSLDKFRAFSSNTALTYSYVKPLGWAFLSTYYGLGYVIERSTAGKGTGISQNMGLGLSNIDFNKYATFNTSANYSSVENTTGDVKSDTKSFSANATNKIGRKYVLTSASYDKGLTSTWVPNGDSKNEGYRIDATTGYFKNTSLSGFASNIKTFNETTGWTSVMSEGLALRHQHRIFSSMLDAFMDLTQTERDFTGGKEKTLTKHANAKYSKIIKRPIFWNIEADWTERKENNIVSRIAFIQNRFIYPLRAWLFSFEHRYTLRETNMQEDVNENLYLFKAMRTFVRFF